MFCRFLRLTFGCMFVCIVIVMVMVMLWMVGFCGLWVVRGREEETGGWVDKGMEGGTEEPYGMALIVRWKGGCKLGEGRTG